MEAVQIVFYLGVALGAGALVWRVVRYATTPLHLRWELYPVPHEAGRAGYGGSIFEEMDWWQKPRKKDTLNELGEMFQEIVFLKGVFHHNRKLWWFSFPFHFGLYLLVAWMVLLAVQAVSIAVTGSSVAALSPPLAATGYAGLLLVLAGSIGLLARRAFNPDIRRYSVPVEFLNLLLFAAVCVIALVVHPAGDPVFEGLAAWLAKAVVFEPSPPPGAWLGAELVLGAVLFAYIPLSRMAHFVGKYFLYHDVRWEDEPNRRGGAIERDVKRAFGYRVGWRAPHIQTGKTWAEVGTKFEDEEEA